VSRWARPSAPDRLPPATGKLTTSPTADRHLPSAASVLRRGLVLWGLGHISIGDRRGWLLLLLQPIAIAVLLVAAVQLIDGTRWLVIFPPLAALLVAWVAQAVHAYRRAVELGAQPGGQIQAAVFLPFAVLVVTLFWLVGGRHSSPTATVEGYVIAWVSGRSQLAASMYVTPPSTADLEATWAVQSAYLTERVTVLAAEYGPSSGLDPSQPLDNLRFSDPIPLGAGLATVTADIVRSQRVETMLLGIIPTASQETVVVEPAGAITVALVDQPPPAWLPTGRLASSAWLIRNVEVGASSP
jgi:hypothetical protein